MSTICEAIIIWNRSGSTMYISDSSTTVIGSVSLLNYAKIMTFCYAMAIVSCTFFSSEDVNECNTHNGHCEHECHNTDGSYYCSCNDGYGLGGNGHSCAGVFVKLNTYWGIIFILSIYCSLPR